MIDQGSIVTIVGGSGFIGRYVCETLLRSGARLRVATRHPRRAHFLRPLGGVGQVTLFRADIARPASLESLVAGSQAVINLVGIFKGALQAVHVDGPRHLAEAAAAAGVQSFVQISAIGADPASDSAYAASKAEGEAAVRIAFPGATVIRPSLVFGPEDALTNRFASLAALPFLPVIAPQTRFQPVFVRDLATAIAAAALDPQRHGGKTYEIGGPEILTMHQLMAQVAQLAGQTPDLIDLPDAVSRGIASLGFLPGAPITRDQYALLQRDNVAAPGGDGLAAFGIIPTPLSVAAPEWLGRYRRGGRFAPRATA